MHFDVLFYFLPTFPSFFFWGGSNLDGSTRMGLKRVMTSFPF